MSYFERIVSIIKEKKPTKDALVSLKHGGSTLLFVLIFIQFFSHSNICLKSVRTNIEVLK